MLKREVKRFQKRYAKFLDIIVLLALNIIFLIPILAVMSLTPQVSKNDIISSNDTNQTEVLGTTDNNEVTILAAESEHSVLKTSDLIKHSSNRFIYSGIISKHTAGLASRPILTIQNGTNEDITLNMQIGTQLDGISVSVVSGNAVNRLDNSNIVTLYVSSNESKQIYLQTYSPLDLNFNQSFDIIVNID